MPKIICNDLSMAVFTMRIRGYDIRAFDDWYIAAFILIPLKDTKLTLVPTSMFDGRWENRALPDISMENGDRNSGYSIENSGSFHSYVNVY